MRWIKEILQVAARRAPPDRIGAQSVAGSRSVAYVSWSSAPPLFYTGILGEGPSPSNGMALPLVRPSYLVASALPPKHRQLTSLKPVKMACLPAASTSPCVPTPSVKRKMPILLFDVMDTLVRDPFYQDVPAFFRMSFKDLIEDKHPTSWLEFEHGLIDEIELARKFFKDGRPIDIEGLKECMKRGYSYLDGIEALLQILKQNNHEIHAFTNYPVWYRMIEEKLKLSTYLSWTFCSCNIGKRKPAPDSYLKVSQRLGVEPANCIFIDDRIVNVKAARDVGMIGLHFKGAVALQQELSELGVDMQVSQLQEEA